MKTVIEMAREAGFNLEQGFLLRVTGIDEDLERFAELVRLDEREKWEGQTAVEIHEAVLDEREACANLAEDSDHVVKGKGYYDQLGDADATVINIAAAIRARTGEQK